MTTTTVNTEITDREQALMEVCEWLGNQIDDGELTMLVQRHDWQLTTLVANEHYQRRSDTPELAQLLDCMSGYRGAPRDDVRRSALRDALWILVNASQHFPLLGLTDRLVAYRRADSLEEPVAGPSLAVRFSG